MNDGEDIQLKLTGDDNTQIHSRNDTIAAIGDHAIAAGGDLTINHGSLPEEHTKLFVEILESIRKMNESKGKNEQFEIDYEEAMELLDNLNIDHVHSLSTLEYRGGGHNLDYEHTLNSLHLEISELLKRERNGNLPHSAAQYLSMIILSNYILELPFDWAEDYYYSFFEDLILLSKEFSDDSYFYNAKLIQCIFLYRRNKNNQALIYIKKVMDLIPKKHNLYWVFVECLAAIYVKIGRLIEAEKLYAELIENKYSSEELIYSTAAVKLAQGKFEEAKSLIIRHIETKEIKLNTLDIISSNIWFLLASTHYELDELDDAEVIVNKVNRDGNGVILPFTQCQFSNLQGQILLTRAMASHKSEKEFKESSILREAELLFLGSIELAKHLVSGDELDNPFHNLGMICFLRHEDEDALKMFEKATNPNAPLSALGSMAMKSQILIRLGRISEGHNLFSYTIDQAIKFNAMDKAAAYIITVTNFFNDFNDAEKMMSNYILTSVERKIIAQPSMDSIFSRLIELYEQNGLGNKISFWYEYRKMHKF